MAKCEDWPCCGHGDYCPAPRWTSGAVTEIEFNDRRRRLEIRFSNIPSTQIRGEMKRRGFWWDGKVGVWHLARPVTVVYVRNEPVVQDGFEYALRMCGDYLGLAQEKADQIRKAFNFACQQAGERGMEEACGIA